jgi:hypothetical protein
MIRFFSGNDRDGSTRGGLARRVASASAHKKESGRPAAALNDAACRLRRRCEEDLAHFLACSRSVRDVRA